MRSVVRQRKPGDGPVPFFVQWFTWPVYLVGSLAALTAAIQGDWDRSLVAGGAVAGTALTLIVLEWRYPLKREWRMTRRAFLGRDIKYLSVNGATLALTTWALSHMGIEMGLRRDGLAADLPLPIAITIGLLIFEFLQYWLHRISHEARGRIGGFLWRVHSAHHLPDHVYVLMHAAAHPINTFLVRSLVTVLPLWALGFSPEAVAYMSLIIGVQGVFSHTNLDIRTGWFNYVLVGTELHRSHHGAGEEDGLNFGVVTPLWDLVFGTFRYSPGAPPNRLGVGDPSAYPDSYDVAATLAFPFRQSR